MELTNNFVYSKKQKAEQDLAEEICAKAMLTPNNSFEITIGIEPLVNIGSVSWYVHLLRHSSNLPEAVDEKFQHFVARCIEKKIRKKLKRILRKINLKYDFSLFIESYTPLECFGLTFDNNTLFHDMKVIIDSAITFSIGHK